MKFSMEELSPNQVRVILQIDAQRFHEALNVVPSPESDPADETAFGQAIDHLISECYAAAIAQLGITPVSEPEFEDAVSDEVHGTTVSFIVYTKPPVVLGTYKGIPISCPKPQVTDKDVTDEIQAQRRRRVQYQDIFDRPVQLNDEITCDMTGYVDGIPFEGGLLTNFDLTVGSGLLFPGFDEQLIGGEIGREFDIHITFPDDYYDRRFQGKPAVFRCLVTAIREKHLPPLDDAFAQEVSHCLTFQEYKAQVYETLLRQAQEQYNSTLENLLIRKLTEEATVDIPEVMIEDQISQQIAEYGHMLQQQGMDIRDYYRFTGESEASLRHRHRDTAVKVIRTQLVLDAIVTAEGLTATEEEVDLLIRQSVGEDDADLMDYIKANLYEEYERTAAMRKAIELVKASAVIL